MEPIIGVRYKCTVCDESEEIDLCSKCMALGTFANGIVYPENASHDLGLIICYDLQIIIHQNIHLKLFE